MVEVLPIKFLRDEDAPIFGSLNVTLAKLKRLGIPVGDGIVVTPPQLKLKTTLEHYDFGSREVFEQNLTLVKKEIENIPIPENLLKEVKVQDKFLVGSEEVTSVKNLWLMLLKIWLEEIKSRLWKEGFIKGLAENLEPQIVNFVDNIEAIGVAYQNNLIDDVIINFDKGEVSGEQLKKLVEIVELANKKLVIPHAFRFCLENEVKITSVLPFIHSVPDDVKIVHSHTSPNPEIVKKKSAVKVFYDLSTDYVFEPGVDGVFINGDKIFDLNKPQESFEELTVKIVESAIAFEGLPVLVKLAEKSEGMGKVRGTLKLLHQKSLFHPQAEAISFARHKKGLTNVHIVIPFVRTASELTQIKRELAVEKLHRKSSLEQWMEVSVPENIINLENYLEVGIDGAVLNLDELIAHLNGFDHSQEDLFFYKNEVSGLLKFIEDSLKLLHKSKIPFITQGSLSFYPEVLEFLVEKGVYGVVAEKYEAHSAYDLLHHVEKRIILRRAT